jgi:hypothetical protein
MVRWEGQPKHRAAAPATTPLLSRTPCDQHSRLSQTRRASGGETRHGGRRRTTDQDNETNTAEAGGSSRGGKGAGSSGKRAAQQQRQSQTRQDGQGNSKSKQSRTRKRSSTANDSAIGPDGGRQRRAATDTPLGVSYTRRQERHRSQPGWHAGHIFTRPT